MRSRFRAAASWCWAAGVCLACGSGPQNPVHEALARKPPQTAVPSVAFRFSPAGEIRLYTLPQLQEVAWQFEVQGLKVDKVIGFSSEHDEVYFTTVDSSLAVLDLSTGRIRSVQSQVAVAALGPTGRLHLVRRDGSVASLEHRTVEFWPDTLRPAPFAVWGMVGGRALVGTKVGGVVQLQILSAGKPALSRNLEARGPAVGRWGDLVAASVDSGVLLFDPAGSDRADFIELDPPPVLLAVSPAEHRIYAVDERGVLKVLSRYDRKVLKRLRLPAPAADMRVDPLGRILLVRPARGDSLWVVDLVREELKATVPGRWREDLPTVAPDGTILMIAGRHVLAMAADSFVVTGRVPEGARDRWLAVAWDPRRPALEIVKEAGVQAPAQLEQEIFVQVSSTSNQLWAEDLARSLRQAGMEASVLPPSAEEERYRVVLGPYRTRDEAEAIGRKLGRSFWIFTRDRSRPPEDGDPFARR